MLHQKGIDMVFSARHGPVGTDHTADRHEVPRGALVERIRHSGSKVLALCAGRGYGKTTLLKQYMQIAHEQTWYDQILSFRVAPSGRFSMSRATAQTEPDDYALESLCELFGVQQVTQTLERFLDQHDFSSRITLVCIDGWQYLPPATQGLFETFVEVIDAKHHVLLTSFDASQISILPALLARGEGLALGPSELAFQFEETRLMLGRGAAGIHNALNGWPLGVSVTARGSSGEHDSLSDWLLRPLELPVRQLLRSLSVFELWSEHHVDALGMESSPGWFESLFTTGLPGKRLDAETFQPHAWIRQKLHQELRQQPKLFTPLSLLAGAYLESQGNFSAATQRYHDARDLQAALRCLEPVAENHLHRGEYHELRHALEGMPETQLPLRLREWLGVARIQTNARTEGVALLKSLCRDHALEPCSYLALAEATFFSGDLPQGQQWLERARSAANDDLARIAVRRFEIQLLGQTGQLEQAAALIPDLLREAQRIGNPFANAACLSRAATIYFRQGNLEGHVDKLQRLLEIQEVQGSRNQLVSTQTNLALSLAFLGHTGEALLHAQAAVERAARLRDLLEVRTIINLALVQQLAGQFENALDTALEGLEFVKDGKPEAFELVELWLYVYSLSNRKGDTDLAERAARQIEAQLASVPRHPVSTFPVLHEAYLVVRVQAQLFAEARSFATDAR
jgi:tetratricopeptide (TPR) repeat protein